MKKTVLKMLAFSVLSFFALPIFTEDAKVMAIVGKAEILRDNAWVALSVGDFVPKGAVISTGFKSELLLKVNESNVKLGALTRMTVEQLVQSSSENKTSLFIDSGKVNVEVNKTAGKRENFRVSSPVATASVRGTSFTFGSDGKLATHSGLVTKGPSVSKKAAVAPDNEDSADVADVKKAGVFTAPFAEGIPVYAGQESDTDSLTGQATSPQKAVAKRSKSVGGNTETLASRESVSTSNVSAVASNTPSQSTFTSGSLAITISFDDDDD